MRVRARHRNRLCQKSLHTRRVLLYGTVRPLVIKVHRNTFPRCLAIAKYINDAPSRHQIAPAEIKYCILLYLYSILRTSHLVDHYTDWFGLIPVLIPVLNTVPNVIPFPFLMNTNTFRPAKSRQPVENETATMLCPLLLQIILRLKSIEWILRPFPASSTPNHLVELFFQLHITLVTYRTTPTGPNIHAVM